MDTDGLLTTKLQLPAARPDAVARPRLLAALGEGLRLGRRLTLVSAPAGFGKTTLLRQWAGAPGLCAAWLTLDAGDNEPERFLAYLAAAVAGAGSQERGVGSGPNKFGSPEAGDRSGPNKLGSPEAGAGSRERLVALVNELSEGGRPADHPTQPLVLVLDDYHAIREFAVHEMVAFLLSHLPAGVHLAIGTREDPPLPLARLRALDQVTEVRERGLRFSPQEAGAFFGQTMHLSLTATSVASLTARTEGWIAGLQLAGLALRQSGAAEEFVAAFAGDDRYVVDYLLAEVLGRVGEPVRRFLRQTSILERLSGPLCDAVTGREDSQSMLEQLEGANLFLVSLDNRREWFRYHVLFAEVLRLGLGGEERAELHARAEAWFRSHPEAPGAGEAALHHGRLAARSAIRRIAPLGQSGGWPYKRSGSRQMVEPLSEREREVLGLIAAGLSNQEIAERLVIAPGTVKRHLNNVYGKLGVGSRTQAVAVGREVGVV